MQFVCVIAFNHSNKLKSRIEDSCESHIYHGCDELMDFLPEVDALEEFTATMKAGTTSIMQSVHIIAFNRAQPISHN